MTEQDPNIVPMDNQPEKPQYIAQQTNNNCQQFFGPVSGCVFAMPGANVTQQMGPAPAANTKAAKTEPKEMRERKSTLPKLTKPAPEKPRERMTFKKRGIQDAHLRLFYQKLIEFEWITKDNNEQDFLDLFSGELSDCKIIWGRDSADSPKYGKGTLVYMFRYLADVSGVIDVPKNYSIPNILMGHFVDKEGNFLTDLDKGDKPNDKAGLEVLEFEKVLKINAGHQGRRASRDEDLYDDALNSYELEEEGLSVRKGRL